VTRLVAVDAGNTRIKWGVHDGREWVARGAAPIGEEAAFVQLAKLAEGVERAIASNVAGPAVEARLRSLCEKASIPLRIIESRGEQLGVVNGYREPRQLGSDRWAALVAAHATGGNEDKLVVNAGTALTIDALAAGGRFLGGLIVPGPALMRRSLDRGTAALRLTQGEFREFPASTADAITSGALQACAGAVERMRALTASRGSGAVRVLLSGGAAGELAAHLPLPHAIHENLVLDGLVLIARNS
jgi:type III pantothenate kinase